MRRNFKVILDADDVLYDCNGEAVRRLNLESGTDYSKTDITRWGTVGSRLDERMKYFEEPKWIASLPVLPGAKEFVSVLSKEAEILVVTNVAPKCAGARMDAIIRDFPEISPSNILIGGRKDLLRADMMLDDAPHNLERAAGVRYPVLFRQPWNYGETGFYSVSHYQEFLTLVGMVQDGLGNRPYAGGGFQVEYDSIVLVGPSGSGKKRLADTIMRKNRKVRRVTTYTTKPGGIGYNHISPEQFEEMSCQFFEKSCYMGHRFGTRSEDVQEVINDGGIPLLIMDINGMVSMKHKFHPLSIYVSAPREECIRNILGRDLTVDEMVKRIAALDMEARNEQFCDITLSADSDFSI